MRRTVLITVTLVVAVTGLALADDRQTSYVVTGSTVATTKAGSLKSPVPTAAHLLAKASAAGGVRPTTPERYVFGWTGVQENGKTFPVCTADTIDAAQSDKGCPAGAVVATGTFTGEVGATSNPASSIGCTKSIKVYNAGAGKMTFYFYGDPSTCAGVGYLAPFAASWKRLKDGSSQGIVNVPDNVVKPLPGLEGAVTVFDLTFRKLSATVKGHTVGYLQSIGCGKSTKRTFSWTVTEPGRTYTESAKAGTCR